MPRRDKTGPNGAGPMTGRGLGNCNNTNFQFPQQYDEFGNRMEDINTNNNFNRNRNRNRGNH